MTQAADPADVPPTIDYAPDPAPRTFEWPLPALWVWFACVILALIANAGSLIGELDFLWTDKALVRDNHLLNRLPGLQAIWFGIADPQAYPLPQYAPLAQTLFFIERLFYGDRFVAGYRLTSLLLHATAGLMLWHLLRRLAFPAALATALLFVAHPIAVESVTLLSERRNPVAALFALASAFLLLRAVGVIAPPAASVKFRPLPDDPKRLYAIAALLFVLGLFAHAAIAPVPLVVLLIVWWKRRNVDRPAVARPLLLTCVALAVAGFAMLSLTASIERARSGATSPTIWSRAPTTAGDLAVRAQLAGRAVAFYVQKLLVPYPLSVDYPRWQTPRDVESFRTHAADAAHAATTGADVAPGDVVAYLYPAVAVAILVALWTLRHRLGVGPFVVAASFALLLAPALGFVDLGWMRYAFVANRAAYLASVPFLAGIAWAASVLLARAGDRTAAVSLTVVALLLCEAGSIAVARRAGVEADFWRLSANANGRDRRTWLPRFEYASALLVTSNNPVELAGAAAAIEQVRRIRPDEPAPIVTQGLIDVVRGRGVEGMRAFDSSIQNFPSYAPAYFEAGESFRVAADQRPTDPGPRLRALQLFVEASQRDPLDARYFVRVGQTAWEIAKRLRPDDASIAAYLDQAATAFDRAVVLRPYDVGLLVDVAGTLTEMGRVSDVAALLASARAIEPRRADIYVVTAQASALAGDANGAEAALDLAMEIDPTLAVAPMRLGMLRQSQERWDEARALFQKAAELAPRSEEPRRKLAEVEAAAATRPSATQPGATTRP